MNRDDGLNQDLCELEEQIEAKVDSLFVEGEIKEVAPTSEGDPWKDLKEHFLTLEWEINLDVLEKVSEEVHKLQARYTDHPLSVLLGWMDRLTGQIRAKGADVDQESMKVFHQLKDGLLHLAEDPFQDPRPIVDPLIEQVLQFLEEEDDEAATIAIKASEGIEDQMPSRLDHAMDSQRQEPEESPLDETLFEEVSLEQKLEPQETDHPHKEQPTATAELTDLEQIKATLAEGVRKLQTHLEGFQGDEDPLGLAAMRENLTKKLNEFTEFMLGAVGSLREAMRALEVMDLAPTASEPEVVREEVLFVSVSNRILAIPMACVRGIFRVPSKVTPQLSQVQEAALKGKIVPLWKKLGLGRALYMFPKAEKRIILAASAAGEVGLVVDGVLARHEVVLNPVDDMERSPYKGSVAFEKAAFVIDTQAL